MIAIGIAAFLFMIALTKDIQCILDAIDQNARFKRKRAHISAQLVEFVELYSDVKQLSTHRKANDRLDTYFDQSTVVYVYFLYGLVSKLLFERIYHTNDDDHKKKRLTVGTANTYFCVKNVYCCCTLVRSL